MEINCCNDTSGHNESCLSFMLNNYLFTGDLLTFNVKLVTNLPRSNKAKIIRTYFGTNKRRYSYLSGTWRYN